MREFQLVLDRETCSCRACSQHVLQLVWGVRAVLLVGVVVCAASQDGLKMAVAQHFATLVVNEEDIFRAFVQTCLRRHQGSVATADHAATLRNLRKLPKPTPEQGVS